MKLFQGNKWLYGGTGPLTAAERLSQPYLRFAQVSDLHFTLNPRVGEREARSPLLVDQMIDHLNSLQLDFVVLTGDLIHLPRLIGDDLPALAQRLARLKAPWYPVVGNHDVAGSYAATGRAIWLKTFAGHLGDTGRTWFCLQPRPDVHLLALDTTDHEGGPYTWTRGYVGNEQLAWLEATLAERPNDLTILAMHHPIQMPLPLILLSMTPEHRRRLEQVLVRAPQVQLVISGHFHVSRIQTLASRAHQVACPGLIEYPHAFRVFTLQRGRPGEFWCDLEWHRLDELASRTAIPGLFNGLVRPLLVAGRRGGRKRRFRVSVEGSP